MSLGVCVHVCASNLSASVYPSVTEMNLSVYPVHCFTVIQGHLLLTEQKSYPVSIDYIVVRAIETIDTEV